jgi:hypothetical protein
MKPEKTSQWSLDYRIKNAVGGSDEKLVAELHRTGKGVDVKVYGGIPAFEKEVMEQVFSLLSQTVASIDGLDAEKPEDHATALRSIGDYCYKVADLLSGK